MPKSIPRTCEICGAAFLIWPYEAKNPRWGRFCSRVCANRGVGRESAAKISATRIARSKGTTYIGGTKGRAHRLVAEAKIGRPLRTGEVVHHVNGNRRDNRPENIEVFPSHAEHMRWHMANSDLRARMYAGQKAKDAFNRKPTIWGESHHKAKLTEEQVREIRRRRAAGETIMSLGSEFGISHTTVSNIANFKIWKHVPSEGTPA